MDALLSALSTAFVAVGVLVFLVAAAGVLRFPDYFTRTHAVGMTDTLGMMMIAAGLMLREGASLNTAKLLFLLIFLGLGNPTVAHALMRAALRNGVEIWRRGSGGKR